MRDWRKSSHSKNYGDCVEVASGGGIAVRDSKDPGPVLVVPADAWRAFTRSQLSQPEEP